MPLQLRRGLEADRTTIVPANGELIYTTDTKQVYVGDGSTVGGVAVTGGDGLSFSTIAVTGQSNVVAENSTDTLTLVAGSGIGITTNAGTDTVTFSNTGLLNVVEDTSPQLGGSLDVNGFQLVSTGNENIVLNPAGTGKINLFADVDITGNISKTGSLLITPSVLTQFGSTSLGIDGNVNIVRNSYSSAFLNGFTFSQHHSTPDSVNFLFYRSRGTGTTPTTVVNGDDIADITFAGHTASGISGCGAISGIVEGVPSSTNVPMKFQFVTNNGSGLGVRAELSPAGVWKIDQLGSLSGTNINVLTNNTITIGDVRLGQNGLSTVNSNANLYITANASGRIYLDNLAWPTGDGTSGQALVTDGAGNLSWTSVNSLGSLSIVGSIISSNDSTRIEFQENINIVGNFTVEGTLGYGLGTGGIITQSTNKTTGVIFDRPCGTITMASGNVNSGDEVSFTVTNSFVDDTDVVLISIKGGGTAGAYLAQCDQVNNGSFRITITNISNSTLDETIALNFIIVKSVSA